jgi:serine/threonine-protein kinase
VKKLHITAAAAAHRELAIAADLAGRPLQHVIPVLDAGQDANSDGYFVVTPVAEYSLQQHLDRNGPVAETYAASILINIVSGLEELPHRFREDLGTPMISSAG